MDDGNAFPFSLPNVVEKQYIRLLAHSCAGYERIKPELFPVVTYLVEAMLPDLYFAPTAESGCVYRVSLSGGEAPVRGRRLADDGERIVFFCCGRAQRRLLQSTGDVEKATMSAALETLQSCGQQLEAGIVHLVSQWQAGAPARQYRRHVLDGDLTAVRGLADARRALVGSAVSDDKGFSAHFADVSRGGVGAVVPSESVNDTVVGELIALRAAPEGVWQLGVVRRFWRESKDVLRLGVEIISASPSIGCADDGRARVDVLVCDKLRRSAIVRIIAPAGHLAADAPLFLSAEGGLYKLRPRTTELLDETSEVWSYEVL